MQRLLTRTGFLTAALTAFTINAGIAGAETAPPTAEQQTARAIYQELVEIRTVEGRAGTTVQAAQALAARLVAAGFPADDVKVLSHAPGYGALVARYRGDGSSGKKPILLMAHLDVVDALREDWSRDPFTFIEEDGWFYGRGTSDNKAGAAALVATFLRLKAEGFMPGRDLIIALTGDEETGGNSIKWLVNENRDLLDADFALNSDGGGGGRRDGKPVVYSIQASEKVYLTYIAQIRNAGGHSSVPQENNAIYRLAAALGRLSAHRFPTMTNEITRAYFSGLAEMKDDADMAAVGGGDTGAAADRLSADPYYNAMLHTTCVATRLAAGHADNALPQLAEATINCRILPGTDPDSIDSALTGILADDGIELTRDAEPTLSPPSPLREDVMAALRGAVDARYPGLPILPGMSTGATDGLFVRNAGIPVYGVAGVFRDLEDIRAHGRDERVRVEDFYATLDHWHALLTTLAKN